MEASLGLTALLLSLPANQRVASRVDLEVKAPRLLSLAGFWVKKSRYFSEFSSRWNILSHWFFHSFLVLGILGGSRIEGWSWKMQIANFLEFWGKMAWQQSSESHPHARPQRTISDEIAPYFFFPQSQWLVCALGPIFNNFDMLSNFFSEVYVFRYIFCIEHWMKPFVKYMKK